MKITTPRWVIARGRAGSLQPDIVPMLSAGKHRSPRSGACFMEFASFLAGERWSDHPACTHPALAHLARAVNDLSSSQGRNRLAPLIPSVIGLTSDDPRLGLLLAIDASAAALPAAPLDRQHSLAVGALVCLDALQRTDAPPAGGPASVEGRQDAGHLLLTEAESRLREALADAPEAERWATDFLGRNGRWRRAEVTPRQVQATVAMAVDGVRSACTPFPDERLYALLASSIELTERFVAAEQASAPAPHPTPHPAAPSAIRTSVHSSGARA